MRLYICGLCLMLLGECAFAQPGTEIYLFDVKVKKGKVFITNPQNITHRAGYDNQPFFHPDQPWIYYTSADTSGRTDIMVYDYRRGITTPVTHTAEREYSPTVTPDKRHISCIVQRDNGTQDLCQYPIEGGPPVVLINSLKVGYHAWLDGHTVMLFVLGEPNTLRAYNITTARDTVLEQNIGRSLHRIPGEQNGVSFVHKVKSDQWLIKKYMHNQAVTLGETPPGREDVAWSPTGGIFVSNDKQILYAPDNAPDDRNLFRARTPHARWFLWQPVDIQFSGELKTISRLAVSPKGDKIAVVINE